MFPFYSILEILDIKCICGVKIFPCIIFIFKTFKYLIYIN